MVDPKVDQMGLAGSSLPFFNHPARAVPEHTKPFGEERQHVRAQIECIQC